MFHQSNPSHPAVRRSPGWLRIAFPAATATGPLGVFVGPRWYEEAHPSLMTRYDRQLGTSCLAGTPWATEHITASFGPRSGPARLVVQSLDPNPAGPAQLTLTAPSALGTDPLRPADKATWATLVAHLLAYGGASHRDLDRILGPRPHSCILPAAPAHAAAAAGGLLSAGAAAPQVLA